MEDGYPMRVSSAGGRPASNTPLALLRSRTGGQHRQVERQLDLSARCRREGLLGYANILAVLHGVHAALEDHLDRALSAAPVIGDWPRRRGKPGWLATDLRHLPAPTIPRAALRPHPESLPVLGDRGAVLGCLYVVEGSTLGGRTAARQVRDALGERAPIRFFTGYGRDTGRLWRSLHAELERWVAQQPESDGLISAARATFALVETQFATAVPGPGGHA